MNGIQEIAKQYITHTQYCSLNRVNGAEGDFCSCSIRQRRANLVQDLQTLLDKERLDAWKAASKHEQYKFDVEKDKQYSEMASDINAKLNKQYRGELQEMQRQKNKVMAINIMLTKKQCADELEEELCMLSWVDAYDLGMAKDCIRDSKKYKNNLIKKWRENR